MKRFLRDRTNLVVLAAFLLIAMVLAGTVPLGIYGLGIVAGGALALHAVGIVLVYRSNRVINFAQLQMGAFAANLFVVLVRERVFLNGLLKVCPGCLPRPRRVSDIGVVPQQFRDVVAEIPPDATIPSDVDLGRLILADAPGWAVQLNFWLSVVVSVGLSVLLLWLLYTVVIRRFTETSRLVLTVITIGAGYFVLQAGQTVLNYFFDPETEADRQVAENANIPISWTRSIGSIRFQTEDFAIVLLAIACSVALGLVLRRSTAGVVLRGAADNPQRAQTLGVNVGAVTGRVWIAAGVFSGLAWILVVARVGDLEAVNFESEFVKVLAAAVIGGLVSLPLAIAGAFSVGLLESTIVYSTSSSSLVGVMLLGIVLALLLAQRRRSGRAEREADAMWEGSLEIRPTPAELRGVETVRRTTRLLAGVTIVIVLAYPWMMSPSQITLATTTMAYAMIGLSLLVLTGWAGQISLGQMAFAAVGAWVAAVLGWPLPLGLLAGACAGAVVAGLVGIPALRLPGLYLAVVTLAMSTAVSAVLLSPRYLGKKLPPSLERPVLLGIDFRDERAFFYLTLVFVVLSVLAVMGMRRSRTARALIACKDNEAAAQAFGINLVRARIAAFAISGFLAAAAGVLYSYGQGAVRPQGFSPEVSVRLFLIAIVGGLGSIAGPILGAVWVGVLELLGGTPVAIIAGILGNPGLGVLVVFYLFPGGLSQVVYGIRDMWLRRVASRYRIVVPSLWEDRRRDPDARLPIGPKLRPTGGAAFVPPRFRLDGQWLADAERAEKRVRADV